MEEILDYAKHGYPSQDVSYRKLASFLRDELHISEEKIEELLYIVYKEFSMDGMLSDIMEEFKKRDIVFDSDRQMERFAPIMMEVNNNTRMLDFRGYTPNEVSPCRTGCCPGPGCSGNAVFRTDGKYSDSKYAAEKRKYIRMIHARVEAERNTRNAAEETDI